MRLVWLVVLALVGAVPMARAAVNPDAVAIIIGNKTYGVGTPSVTYADHDADDMEAYVRNVLGYIHVYRRDNLTRNGFVSLFGTAERPEGSLLAGVVRGHEAQTDVFVYYSGHGYPGPDHGAYLLPTDFVPGLLEETAYPLKVLKANLGRLHARSVVLVVDACFTGSSAGGAVSPGSAVYGRPDAGTPAEGVTVLTAAGMDRRTTRSRPPPGSAVYGRSDAGRPAEGVTVLTAAGMDQVANWDEPSKHGLFTSYFLRAVAGEAAGDGGAGRRITAGMVRDFVNGEMRFPTSLRGAQRAELEGREDVVLAMAPAGPAPQPVPAGPPGVTDCDRLAQPPRSVMGRVGALVDGVALDRIDGAAALAACEDAMRRLPNEARFEAYRGRALEKLGRLQDAVVAYRDAASRSNAVAQTNLGIFYANGRGGLSKDDREAARLYRLAADQGEPAAQTNLGWFYEKGRGGLSQDDREAARLYRLAADQGYAAAQNNLGWFYEYGRGGLSKDDREAARLYRLAADQGYAGAQNNLGVFYEKGRGGLSQDDREAARLFRLAADQGGAWAQNNLGFFYEKGRGGLSQDDREAARLYRLAADQGNPGGQNGLGWFYEKGRGGLSQDDREAARLYRLAADQGNTAAQNNLGTFYETGRGGLPKDIAAAVRLYQASARQGNEPAQANLKRLNKTW